MFVPIRDCKFPNDCKNILFFNFQYMPIIFISCLTKLNIDYCFAPNFRDIPFPATGLMCPENSI